MSGVAAVDIGTNSTRLLVADVDGTGARRRGRHRSTGACASPGSARASTATARSHPTRSSAPLAVLREYRAALDEHGVDRGARDRDQRGARRDEPRRVLRRRARRARRRARAALGRGGGARCRSSARPPTSTRPRPYLVVDIGGGSTEFVLGTDAPDGLVSLDIGCVRITEQFLHSDPPAPEELSNAVAVVRDHLADVDARDPRRCATAATLVGLAGTSRPSPRSSSGLPEYDPERIHHFRLTRAAAEDVFRTLATETGRAARATTPGSSRAGST